MTFGQGGTREEKRKQIKDSWQGKEKKGRKDGGGSERMEK